MSVRGLPAPVHYTPASYWEQRARRFAAEGRGLAAVCSYGMPGFYNRAIDREQRRALAPWLRVAPGTRVLDVGCGVGRWSCRLAARGAQVTGIDISPTMIAHARARAQDAGVAGRCHFMVGDLARLALAQRFDLVLGVTVLQHILDPRALAAALQAMSAHLAPGGRMVLLEAAPVTLQPRCDSSVFRARPREHYLELARRCGLRPEAVEGVDPAPFRTRLLPHLRRLPRPLSLTLLALATALSAPLNALLARRAPRHSWHAVFVLRKIHAGDTHAR